MNDRRDAQPLVPRAVAIVRGEALVVHANWDRFELRASNGDVVVSDAAAPWLFHAFHFVSGRFLACTVGGGVSVHEVRIHDLAERVWTSPIPCGRDELGILGVDPASPIVAIEASTREVDAIALWDVATQARSVATSSVSSPPSKPLVAGSSPDGWISLIRSMYRAHVGWLARGSSISRGDGDFCGRAPSIRGQ